MFARASLSRLAANHSLSYGCYYKAGLDRAWSGTLVVANQLTGSKSRNKVDSNKSCFTVYSPRTYTLTLSRAYFALHDFTISLLYLILYIIKVIFVALYKIIKLKYWHWSRIYFRVALSLRPFSKRVPGELLAITCKRVLSDLLNFCIYPHPLFCI